MNALTAGTTVTIPEQAWREMRRALRGFVARRVANPADAEDIVHQVFAKALTRLPELRSEDRLAPWLYRIARNAVIDHYRRSGRSAVSFAGDAADVVDDDDQADEPCLHTCLNPLLSHLDEGAREALILADRDGMKQEEVARRLGISHSGAKSRIVRARQKLRDAFEACCRFEFDRRGQVIEAERRTDTPSAGTPCCPARAP